MKNNRNYPAVPQVAALLDSCDSVVLVISGIELDS